MLDLSIIADSYFDLKLVDGRIIYIKKLNQKQVIAMTAMDKEIAKANEKKDYEKVLMLNTERMHMILNNNKENIVISKEEVEELNPEMMSAIIIAYTDWMQGINNNPN